MPLATLILRIPPVYVMSKDDHSSQSSVHPQATIPLKVRIMGSVQPTAHGHTVVSNRTPASLAPIKPVHRDMAGSELFLVAKDLCTLIHTRKGNVAKSIGGFAEWEKARMAVLCPRSNGSVSTHILTVLSMAGMYRLLNASRSPLSPVIMKVLYEVINNLFDEEAERREKQAAEAEAEALRAATASAKAEEGRSSPCIHSVALHLFCLVTVFVLVAVFLITLAITTLFVDITQCANPDSSTTLSKSSCCATAVHLVAHHHARLNQH